MNEPILKAVAMPPRLFWAPLAPALLNLALQISAIFMILAVSQANPLWIILTTLFPSHIALIIWGVKEPHLTMMLRSQGPFMKSYKNIYPDKGRKLAS